MYEIGLSGRVGLQLSKVCPRGPRSGSALCGMPPIMAAVHNARREEKKQIFQVSLGGSSTEASMC